MPLEQHVHRAHGRSVHGVFFLVLLPFGLLGRFLERLFCKYRLSILVRVDVLDLGRGGIYNTRMTGGFWCGEMSCTGSTPFRVIDRRGSLGASCYSVIPHPHQRDINRCIIERATLLYITAAVVISWSCTVQPRLFRWRYYPYFTGQSYGHTASYTSIWKQRAARDAIIEQRMQLHLVN